MSDTTHIHVRDSRDRLIDLLGIAETYPLRDLAVRDERLTVPFGTAAKIPVEISQPDVLYQLHDRENQLVERAPQVPVEAEGNGHTIFLETPGIAEDITYKILARKSGTGREAYLHQTATVKVGLDLTLEAKIRDAPLLDPTIDNPADTDVRIVDYGARVEVEIKDSQEGVDYRLVYLEPAKGGQTPKEVELSETEVRGTRVDIILRTKPVFEDTDIRIRATKTFDQSEDREPQTDLLDVVLPLKVRANKALQVSIVPSSIIDFKQEPVVKIAATQKNAEYRLYIRTIPDRDYIHRSVPAADVIKVSVPDALDVQVRKPESPEIWQTPEGYMPLGDAQAGTGKALQFPIMSLTDDSLIIIQALKAHQPSAEDKAAAPIPSAVQLDQAAVVLVRPDPAPALRLKVLMNGTQTSGTIQVFGGQPGIFYFFHRGKEGKEMKEIGLPAYFHKRDDRDDTTNKGLGQLNLEIDFVVATDPPAGKVSESADLAKVAPEPPLLETDPLPTDVTLYIEALKAQTQIKTLMDKTAQIQALPEIHPEEPWVDPGKAAKILVLPSQKGDKYQLMLNEVPVKKARNGNGDDLAFITESLNEDTTFEMVVTRPAEGGIPVEQVVRLPVMVRPDAKLPVSVRDDVVDHNMGTEIRVETSQPRVIYCLLVDGKPTGDSVEGNGDTIVLPTGPITEDTTFVIRATRISNTDISVELDARVHVAIRTDVDES